LLSSHKIGGYSLTEKYRITYNLLFQVLKKRVPKNDTSYKFLDRRSTKTASFDNKHPMLIEDLGEQVEIGVVFLRSI